jgi:Uncharacterised protein family (UPF0158)
MAQATGAAGAADREPGGGARRAVPIDLDEVGAALDDGSWEHTYYLDTQTGEVLLVSELWDPGEARRQRAAVEAAPMGRYLEVPRSDSRAGYRDLEAFIATVADERVQEVLEVAIQGKGAFRRFKDVLGRYPAEQTRWFAFRAARLEARARAWLADEGLEPAPRPGG